MNRSVLFLSVTALLLASACAKQEHAATAPADTTPPADQSATPPPADSTTTPPAGEPGAATPDSSTTTPPADTTATPPPADQNAPPPKQ
jgi:hypothetical protein